MRRGLLATIVAAFLIVVPSAYAVDDVLVQGTTDVRDAGLLDDVIIPGFEAAYPQYNLVYTAVGTGQALTNARAGQGDAVLTHAAPSEAQFVADGYSAEPFGRAIFYSDYVILGPASDPAGVLSGAAHDAPHALELIAAAGQAGTANFVSRGDNSGTNVAEQQFWNLTTGVGLCFAGNGRKQPSTTPGATCPTTVTDNSQNPSWYHRANLGQAATVQLAAQCPYGSAYTEATNCYEMTDRGTFNRLISTGAISGLKVVTDRNDASARGGKDLMINSFHAYVVNAAKFDPGTIDTAGGTAFVDYLTSPGFQVQLASYPNTADPAFFASAAPVFDADSLPTDAKAGKNVTVAGKIANAVPGTPSIAGVQVNLVRIDSGGDEQIKSATTAADGTFSMKFKPDHSGAYELGTPQITETNVYPVSAPGFGDLLSPGSFPAGTVTVTASIDVRKIKADGDGVEVRGSAFPDSGREDAKLVLLGKRLGDGSGKKERKLGSKRLKGTESKFDVRFPLKSGEYKLRAKYVDKGAVKAATSDAQKVTVTGG